MRLFFLASDNPKPSGGLAFIYRFCELAVELGHDAFVMHGELGFRSPHIDSPAPVAFNSGWKQRSRRDALRARVRGALLRLGGSATETEPGPGDIVILPENRIFRTGDLWPGVRKLILCQNGFLAERQRDALQTQDVLGAISVSAATLATMRELMPDRPTWHVPLWLDRGLFHSPAGPREPVLLHMPRKNPGDAERLAGLLRERGVLERHRLRALDGLPLPAVAAAMRESLVFLSFADREGFGLPGAEAIACGCLTVGYTGGGGDEYFGRFGGHPVPPGDVGAFADAVASTIERHGDDPEAVEAERVLHSERILAHYGRDRSKGALNAALDAALGSA